VPGLLPDVGLLARLTCQLLACLARSPGFASWCALQMCSAAHSGMHALVMPAQCHDSMSGVVSPLLQLSDN
jgi:hypothetical protein